MNPVFLVTGGTGAVGPQIVQALHDEGTTVRVLSRRPPPKGLLPDTVEVSIGDVGDESAMEAAMKGVEAVFHLAAVVDPGDALSSCPEMLHRVNVGGTANVVKAAIRARAKRLIYFSTIAVYGVNTGRILTEQSPPDPVSVYARTKLDAERIVLGANRYDGESLCTVLRMGAVYGPKMKGNYKRLVQALERGRFLPIGNGCNRRTMVFEQDVSRAALLVLRSAMAGRIYNVSDGNYHTMKEIIACICKALGRDVPRFAVPLGSARLAALLLEKGLGVLGLRSPIECRMIDKYAEDIRVESRRIMTEMGFEPRFDLDAGWRETIDSMRKNGEIPARSYAAWR